MNRVVLQIGLPAAGTFRLANDAVAGMTTWPPIRPQWVDAPRWDDDENTCCVCERFRVIKSPSKVLMAPFSGAASQVQQFKPVVSGFIPAFAHTYYEQFRQQW
jgi:hypothetical protein